jgi:cellulose 1,4-beta-cellobiosidase
MGFLSAVLLVGLSFSLGTAGSESHPSLTWQQCSSGGSCSDQRGSVVVDANWRWLHDSNSKNCYDGNEWISSLASTPEECSNNCVLDSADYEGTYGITTSGNSLTLKFVTHGSYSTNIGSRVFLLKDESHYQLFKLKNKEFTFTTDVSNLPCGLNGALYFVEMDEDGGTAKHSINKAGAKYGTGYCDAQCPHDIKYIDGLCNLEDWKPQETDENSGNGHYGSCCTEIDIWECNSQATAYTLHLCTKDGQYTCEGKECGDTDDNNRYGGVCDKDGCDYNSWRLGDKTFFGPGLKVDSNKPVTVVTQFITSNGQDSGELVEVRRLYVQDGKVIENSNTNVSGVSTTNSITPEFCDESKTAFGDENDFKTKGGFSGLSKALDKGVVLVLSLWDDHAVNMLWLDSTYPTDKAGQPGADRGPCATTSGDPKDVESQSPDSSVKFSNIRFGPIDSTYSK